MPTPNKIDYPMFVHAALQTFANSANDLFHSSGVQVQAIKTGRVITIRVNGKAVCQVTVEGM